MEITITVSNECDITGTFSLPEYPGGYVNGLVSVRVGEWEGFVPVTCYVEEDGAVVSPDSGDDYDEAHMVLRSVAEILGRHAAHNVALACVGKLMRAVSEGIADSDSIYSDDLADIRASIGR